MTGLINLSFWLRAIRPHQWSKNLLIFAPVASSHRWEQFSESIFVFGVFCILASSVYIFNDIIDLEKDRLHPKKHRRFTSGVLPPQNGLIVALIMMAATLSVVGLYGNRALLLVFLAYLSGSTAYSTLFKSQPILDIFFLTGLYPPRIIAGSLTLNIELTCWLLAFSVFLLLSLAAINRLAELKDYEKRRTKIDTGRGYFVKDISVVTVIATSSGNLAVLVLALYIDYESVVSLYSGPWLLWLILPVLLYWTNRLVIITGRGGMHDDPISFAIRDRSSFGFLLAPSCIIYMSI